MQATRGVVVVGKEERGVAIVGRVFVKEAIHRLKKPMRIFESHGVLAAQIGLKIGHEQSGGNALAGNVREADAKTAGDEIEKIIIIAADHARLNARGGIAWGKRRACTSRAISMSRATRRSASMRSAIFSAR